MMESEVWKLGWVYLMFGFSYMIYLTFFVAYLTKEIGMDPAAAGSSPPRPWGVITLIFAIAQLFGPFVGGWIKDTTGTFRYAFMLSAAVALTGALSSLLLKRKALA
jgi:nitrate/nitrite transporter NarK